MDVCVKGAYMGETIYSLCLTESSTHLDNFQCLNIFENYNFLLEEQTLIGNYELDNYR